MILVKIGRAGSRVLEYAFDDVVTVEKAFQVANITRSQEERFTVNGIETFGSSHQLHDKDVVLILRGVPQISVKVGRIGEKLMEIKCHQGGTIQAALISAGRLPFKDEEIWIHWEGEQKGTKGFLNSIAENGMIIVLEKPASLRAKIYKILSNTFEDENGEWDRGTNQVMEMLAKDYKLS